MSHGSSGKVQGSAGSAKRRVLLRWFVAGFLLAFAGILFGTSMYTMSPSGRGIISMPLWRYYVTEFGRSFSGPRTLGLSNDGPAAFLENLVTHVLASILAGTVMLGLGWLVARRRRSPASEI